MNDGIILHRRGIQHYKIMLGQTVSIIWLYNAELLVCITHFNFPEDRVPFVDVEYTLYGGPVFFNDLVLFRGIYKLDIISRLEKVQRYKIAVILAVVDCGSDIFCFGRIS